jgi:hypothetical protein
MGPLSLILFPVTALSHLHSLCCYFLQESRLVHFNGGANKPTSMDTNRDNVLAQDRIAQVRHGLNDQIGKLVCDPLLCEATYNSTTSHMPVPHGISHNLTCILTSMFGLGMHLGCVQWVSGLSDSDHHGGQRAPEDSAHVTPTSDDPE